MHLKQSNQESFKLKDKHRCKRKVLASSRWKIGGKNETLDDKIYIHKIRQNKTNFEHALPCYVLKYLKIQIIVFQEVVNM